MCLNQELVKKLTGASRFSIVARVVAVVGLQELHLHWYGPELWLRATHPTTDPASSGMWDLGITVSGPEAGAVK